MLSLDFFPKFIDSAMTRRTTCGALLSIIMVITAACLIWSETWLYIRPPVKEELVSVSELRKTLSELTFSFNFTVSVPCVLLHLDVFDLSGSRNDEAHKTLFKDRLDPNGNPLRVTAVAPKCGSCYGAETDSHGCCNSCEEIVSAYSSKGWVIQDLPNWAQCQAEGVDLSGGEKCRASGALKVHAIDGTFHLAPGINIPNQWGHQHDMSPLTGRLNLSHEIDHVTFGAPLGNSPLDNTRVTQNEAGSYHYRYSLKAVPTVRTTSKGKVTRGFQYTANFAEIPVRQSGRFGPGIFFVYNFAPVAVVSKPDRTSFPIFVARCISIFGGVFMLARLLDSFGYRLNTLEGKMRIGKAE
jgi:hypothetical protein